MELRVSIFQRRAGRRLQWHTLGLGPLNVTVAAASATRARQRLVDGLRRRVAKLWPADLAMLEAVRGRRHEVHRIELNLRDSGTGGGQRRRFAGEIPLIIEPRTRGAAVSGTVELVYHPHRPEEAFVHEPGRDLLDEARQFFQVAWARLEDWQLESLRADSKDRLRLVAFSTSPKDLDEKLIEDKKPTFALLGGGGGEKGEALLGRLGTNLTLRHVDGTHEPCLPRAPYREQLAQLLCGKQKKSVLLVGPSGVGKSSAVQTLVADLLEADDYPSHRNLDRIHNVWQLRGRRIIAGMSYLGQWEQRCVDLLEACRKHRGILFVDDISAWGRIGETVQSDRSLSTFFRGPVARADLTMIAECTPEGYQRLQDDAPGFAASFTTVFMRATDRDETIRMLVHEGRRYERTLDVTFDAGVFRMICDLGGSLGGASVFPGKALELLRALATRDREGTVDLRAAEREVANNRKIAAIKAYRARVHVGLREAKHAVEFYMDKGYWPEVSPGKRSRPEPRSLLDHNAASQFVRPDIGPSEVVGYLADRTGMPEVLLDPQRPLLAEQVGAALRSQIMGQDASIRAGQELIVRLKAGLADRGRPVGVMLFTGPTGTGKTEMAKCLADYLYGTSARLIRFDMSEYSRPDAPSRLIGDRFSPEGTLTSRVRAQPFCVVLLDEIEKADPSVLNLMLQLFDDGRLTDASGQVVDFTHAVVIMTSNLGAKTSASVGFSGDAQDDGADVVAAIRAFFPPELFNRIDTVVRFGALEAEAARAIATRELDQLVQRRGLTERNVFVRYTDALVDRAVRDGFRARDGARSLKRYLEDHVGGYLADTLARSEAAAVRTLWLHEKNGALAMHAEALEEAEAYGHASRLEDALEWSGGRLRAEVPAARKRAEALAQGDGLQALVQTLSDVVRGLGASGGAPEPTRGGQDVLSLEHLRGEVQQLAEELAVQEDYDPKLGDARDVETQALYDGEQLEALKFSHEVVGEDRWGRSVVRQLDARHGPRLPFSSRADFLRTLGELCFLERAIACAAEPSRHAVLVEMTRISTARSGARFADASAGLLEWLATAYAAARGVVERCVVVTTEGTACEADTSGGFGNVARHRILMRIVGPAVLDFFGPEHGSHIRESVSGGTEVVRVRVFGAEHAEPAEHLAQLAGQRAAFVEALERGDAALPEHPDAILPIVRRYAFDPPSPRHLAWLEIEDYPLMYATRTRVRRLVDAMPTIWLLRMGAALGADATEVH